jgi:guanylate kinase
MNQKNQKNLFLSHLSPRPLLVVLSGPSGVGKDAILNRMRQLQAPCKFITTATTRSRRATEKDNIDYYFVSQLQFKEMIEKNQLLEWAQVYGNYYGVPKEPVKLALEDQQDVIVKVDIQGAAAIKKLAPQAVFIFLVTPTLEELKTRLTMRHTESAFDLALRLKTAEEEMKQLYLFDYLVINHRDQIDRAVEEIQCIIRSEKCRLTPRDISL